LKRVHPHFSSQFPKKTPPSSSHAINETKKRFILSGLKVRHLDAFRFLAQKREVAKSDQRFGPIQELKLKWKLIRQVPVLDTCDVLSWINKEFE